MTPRYEFKPRRVRFDYSTTPDHWVPGDPHTTHVVNVLHLLLPAGERWFVDVYKKALPLVEDDDLRRDVRAFIGQEATHARAHDVVLDDLLARGIDPRPFTRLADRVAHLVRPRSAPAWLPERIRGAVDRRYLLAQLAAIAGIEHFTSFMGWWIVTTRALDEAGADPEMMALLRWHGAEEVEHRSVAHDVATYFGDGYIRRARAMAVALFGLLMLLHRGSRFIAKSDPYRKYSYLSMWTEYRRGAKAGVLPTLRSIILATFSYFRPSFRPEEIGSTAQAVAYLASSPATRAVGR